MKENKNISVATRLKMIRQQAKLTQQAAAEKSGLNIRLLQKYESGEVAIEKMTLKNAYRLAKAYNSSIDSIAAVLLDADPEVDRHLF